MNTIVINSKNVAEPSRMDAYAKGRVTVLEPIDGDAITQVSNHRDTYGDKNVPRQMEWEALPLSYDYDNDGSTADDHTVATLKALEGQSVSMTANCFGYSGTQAITVTDVDIEWIAGNSSQQWFKVIITYLHR